MQLIETVREMHAWSRQAHADGLKIGLVPTMGFLHEGHVSLARYARENCDRLAVSIFVNPMQFGPKEDLAAYPRSLERDMALLEPVGVDAVFQPRPEDMYPEGFQTRVEVSGVTKRLCGAFRPGHFTGVATVVLKLFNIVQADLAVFGDKDYQQLVTIRRMAGDLSLAVDVRGRPTVREADGLAMSSRNTYLSPEERRSAGALYEALSLAKDMAARGEKDPAVIVRAVSEHISARPHTQIQYVEIVDPDDLEPVDRLEGPTILALAVFVGKTRLIDNILLTVG